MPNQARRIIIVTELFYPEESATAHIMSSIANNLTGTFDVLVLTGPRSYEHESDRITANDQDTNLLIKRIWAPNLNKNNLASRTFRLLFLGVGLGWNVLFMSKKDDIIFAVTNPAPIMVALALIRKLKSLTLTFLIHDVFPENAAASGIIKKGGHFYLGIKKIFDWAYGAADGVIVIGRDMAEIVSKKIQRNDKNIELIENWADTSLMALNQNVAMKRESLGRIPNKIVIQYAGNIGRAQGILEFVEAVSQTDNSAIHYSFCGSGALTDQLSEHIKGRENFSLMGPFSRAKQALILGSCDISLIVLGPEMYGLGVPSKAYNIMAAGKPILFLGPKYSEIYRLVKETNIGWAYDWVEVKDMVQLINSMSISNLDTFMEIGKKARLLADTRYYEARQIGKFRAFFDSLNH